MQYVYVLNKHGEPLMPCSPGKARILLKQQKACVVKRTPFTIKLLYGSAGYKQPITLGVDAGSKHVGLSASTEKRELYSEEFTPRNDVVELLSTRRQNRRSRRNRKTRYRAPRFNNRIHSKHKGWLAPSVEVKIQEHITVIKRICRILPITLVRVETAEFDTQRLKAMLSEKPLPVGTDYQLGEMYDEYNARQYVLRRDNYSRINVYDFDWFPAYDSNAQEKFEALYDHFGNPSGLYWKTTTFGGMTFSSFDELKAATYEDVGEAKSYWLVWNCDGYTLAAECYDQFDGKETPQETSVTSICVFPDADESYISHVDAGSVVDGYVGCGEAPLCLSGIKMEG